MSSECKEIVVVDNIDRMTDYVVDQWTKLSYYSIESKGYFSVALSGGKTPVKLYQKLAERKNLPWDKTHVFIIDERFVPYDSDDNNYHMINRTLLCHVVIPAGNIHFISTVENTPEESAVRYEQDLLAYAKKSKSQYPPLDMVILGIGDDGHTASLFPDSLALDETRRLAVAVNSTNSKSPAVKRITMTYPVINNARQILFLITGKEKAGVVKDIIGNKKCDLPAARVKTETDKLFFILDKDSASSLPGKYK
jgi:6-phosphogluconolactonase